MRYTLVSWIFAVQCCASQCGQAGGAYTANKKPDIVLGSVQIDTRSVQFYVDFAEDSAVLGFSVENNLGRPLYFPMYGSTYRGLPSVTLDVFVAHSKEEMWVHSSWTGYEILAYYHLGTNRCITRYGDIAASDKPTPESLRGGTRRLPEMDIEKVFKIATFKYDRRSETR
ncbi:MAG: hypothetical protein P8X90_21850 [Desulfobacterales bacterium]|jgi:hypothetical protein